MIREAQVVDRVPYMIIIGQKEVDEGNISIRLRDNTETVTMNVDEFIGKVQGEIRNRK